MDQVEPGVWGSECACGRVGVPMNFGTLALQARVCPLSDICIDAKPHITLSHKALSGSDSWVCQRMKDL